MTSQEPQTAQDMIRMRRRRNLLIVGLVFALAVLFYLVTILKMGLVT
jgi:cell division protein FtsB